MNRCFFFLFRDGEESCRKQLGRVLSIWQERAVYDNSLLDQLSQVLCKFTQCAGTGACWLHFSAVNWKRYLRHINVFFLNVFTAIDGEKKAKKRQYEEIQPDVEDFASQSSPAEPPQVLPHILVYFGVY